MLINSILLALCIIVFSVFIHLYIKQQQQINDTNKRIVSSINLLNKWNYDKNKQ